MVFRWTVWGPKNLLIDQLRDSVGGFRHFFGDHARYVVCTDEPSEVLRELQGEVEVLDVPDYRHGRLSVRQCGLWRKWFPLARIAPGESEIAVDADVFLVGEPYEIWDFCSVESGDQVLALQEARPNQKFYGTFQLARGDLPHGINSGLIGQQPDADLTLALRRQFEWWQAQTNGWGGLHFDEQGAVAAALADCALAGKLNLLPRSRYLVMSPGCNSDRKNLMNVALLHATTPYHPAYFWFQDQIRKVSIAPFDKRRRSKCEQSAHDSTDR